MWTTHKELAWLCERIPEFRKVQTAPGQQIQTWLRQLVPEFLEKFPDCRSDAPGSVLVVRDISVF